MIIGKVARILSDEEVVLNVGSEDGVTQGMEFVVFSVSEGDRIIDPETGDDLGAIETTKGRVKVRHVQNRISRARALTYQVSLPFAPTIETRIRKLKVSEDQVSPFAEDLVVRIGDDVRSV